MALVLINKTPKVRANKSILGKNGTDGLNGVNGSNGIDGKDAVVDYIAINSRIDGYIAEKFAFLEHHQLPAQVSEAVSKIDIPKPDKAERGLQGLKGDTGLPPEHRWDGTKLAFQNPDYSWGEYIDLKGDKGENPKPRDSVIPKAFSTSIDAVRGLREALAALATTGGGDIMYDKLIDTVGTVKYIGEAEPGTTQSDSTWRIKRVDLTTDDIEIVWADGTAEFTKTWDDRLSYDYEVEA